MKNLNAGQKVIVSNNYPKEASRPRPLPPAPIPSPSHPALILEYASGCLIKETC